MNSELLVRARLRPKTAAVIAAVCAGALGGCVQPGGAPEAMFGQTTTLCADQLGPDGYVVVGKRRDFDCGTNAYDSWDWRDARNAAPGDTVWVCRDPNITAGLVPEGWETTGQTGVSLKCGPAGANARAQLRYQP